MLEVKNLSKSFAGIKETVTPVVRVNEFLMKQGEMVALRGESGSGKTTFLHLLAGILSPDEGKIFLDNVELTSLCETKRDQLRASSIGYVFQTFNLLRGFTALENVLLPMSFAGKTDKQWASHLLMKVGLEEKFHHLPGQLSIGQQQRVALARALVNQPSLLLADEPTGNLDRKNASNALEIMDDLCRETNAGLLIVSHDENVISHFEKIVQWSELNRSSDQMTGYSQ
ncbi:MAG: ABC transporter ATP-binding protein [Opitutae bacterium]|nr:ABC transporter ATP-binding protein [Opitutae bacterium]|tara:strand:+ start:4928 stop:5611 length:684 start_codon:yes stop_codon:yes gene_type:complete